MVSLLKIRAMLEQMSIIERKLADFILDNAHLLRDYSSQQLADAVGVSQSSVVKFCQKLDYKGYPDLKLAISEAIIAASALQRENLESAPKQSLLSGLAEQLQFNLQHHVRALLEINDEKTLQDVTEHFIKAEHILIAGFGRSNIVANDMQQCLLQLGKMTLTHNDPATLLQLCNLLSPNSLLLLISKTGENADLLTLAKLARQKHIRVISLTCYKTNSLSLAADLSLFVLPSDDNARFNPILVQLSQQQLCHLVYLMMCQTLNVDSSIEENNKTLEAFTSL